MAATNAPRTSGTDVVRDDAINRTEIVYRADGTALRRSTFHRSGSTSEIELVWAPGVRADGRGAYVSIPAE